MTDPTDYHTRFQEPYYHDPKGLELPFRDFNREVIMPNPDDTLFPLGAIVVRMDDDFWAAAALPYEEYKDKTIQQIVVDLWPEIKDAKFKPDHGDVWWEEYWKENA